MGRKSALTMEERLRKRKARNKITAARHREKIKLTLSALDENKKIIEQQIMNLKEENESLLNYQSNLLDIIDHLSNNHIYIYFDNEFIHDERLKAINKVLSSDDQRLPIKLPIFPRNKNKLLK